MNRAINRHLDFLPPWRCRTFPPQGICTCLFPVLRVFCTTHFLHILSLPTLHTSNLTFFLYSFTYWSSWILIWSHPSELFNLSSIFPYGNHRNLNYVCNYITIWCLAPSLNCKVQNGGDFLYAICFWISRTYQRAWCLRYSYITVYMNEWKINYSHCFVYCFLSWLLTFVYDLVFERVLMSVTLGRENCQCLLIITHKKNHPPKQ